MEPPRTPALSSPSLDLHPLPEEPLEINTEFCEESVTYSELRIHHSSNIQNENITRSLKIKEFPWTLAAVVFACLYLIVLVIAAIMIAKVSRKNAEGTGEQSAK
ncbi:uncharacterized protein AAES06_008899 isoform 2-T2 [Glossophaga mutica]